MKIGDLITLRQGKKFNLGYYASSFGVVTEVLSDWMAPGEPALDIQVGKDHNFRRAASGCMRVAARTEPGVLDANGEYRIINRQNRNIQEAKDHILGGGIPGKIPEAEPDLIEEVKDLPDGFRVVTPELKTKRSNAKRGLVGLHEPHGSELFHGPEYTHYQRVQF